MSAGEPILATPDEPETLPAPAPTPSPAPLPAPAPAAVLTYDNLPPGSTFLRKVLVDRRAGEMAVKITAPAAEPLPATRRAIARAVVVSAAGWTVLALLVCALPFAALAWRQRHLLPWWTAAVFAVFCAALFLLIWRTAFAHRLAATEAALRFSTILLAMPSRLLVEASGPRGSFSHTIVREQVRGVHLSRAPAKLLAQREPAEGDALPVALNHLQIDLAGDAPLRLLHGRMPDEIAWTAMQLRTILRLEEQR